MDQCRVIAFGNQKGGCGKTTNAVNCAAGIAKLGWKVLLVDMDPQHSATAHLGIQDANEFLGAHEMVTQIHDPMDLVIRPGERGGDHFPENLSLIPNRRHSHELESFLDAKRAQQRPSDPDYRVTLIQPQIQRMMPHFDYIILDTPPQPAAPLTLGSYGASQWAILCIMANPLAVHGMLEALTYSVQAVRDSGSEGQLDILGILVGNVDNRRRSWLDYVYTPLQKLNVDHLLFTHRVRTSVLADECQSSGHTFFQHKRADREKVVADFNGVVHEMMYRITHTDDYFEGRLKQMELGYDPGFVFEGPHAPQAADHKE